MNAWHHLQGVVQNYFQNFGKKHLQFEKERLTRTFCRQSLPINLFPKFLTQSEKAWAIFYRIR